MSDGENPSKLSVMLAKAAVQEIESDMLDRSGLRQAYEGIDPGVRREILAKQVAIIARYIEMVR